MTGSSSIGQRVTQRSMTSGTLRGLQESLARSQRVQEQLSSGRLVSRPSDDPSATAASMRLRSQRRGDEQYLRNISDAGGRLEMADDALSTVSANIRRVQELLVSARDPALSDSSRAAIAAELTEIRRGVIDTYNTRWLDRPVFGGTVPGSVAIDATSGAYVGDDAAIVARVSRDVTVRVDVAGSEAGADTLPALLEQAALDVVGDPDAVAGHQDALEAVLSTVLTALGSVGARAAQLQVAEQGVEKERLDLTSRISANEDVDLPKAIMELQSAQVAYQSALGAAAKLMQTSLLDYLR